MMQTQHYHMLCSSTCRLWVQCVALSALWAWTLHAQPAEFVTRPVLGIGARATALSDAYSTLSQDVSVMYWNPAAIAFLQTAGIIIDHQHMDRYRAMNDVAAFPLAAQDGYAVSLGIRLFQVGHLRSSEIEGLENFSYGADIAYAAEVLPQFSVGGLASIDHSSGGEESLSALSSGFGVFYAPPGAVTYGAALTGLGTQLRFIYDGETNLILREKRPRRLQLGAAMQFPTESDVKRFGMSIVNEKIFGEAGVMYRGGIEVWPVEYFALRVGYFTRPGEAFESYGIGFRFNTVRIDYSTTFNGMREGYHQVTLAIDVLPLQQR
jgi:hypothetical protein